MAVIVFPSQYYVGIILSRTSHSDDGMDNLPLGFMTPEGTDSAADKRKGTVETWCRQNMRANKGDPQFKTLENEAMGGFRLLDNVKRVSRYNSSMKWRIEDPRGFELEISSDNLMHIITTTVIDQGEILDSCLWARNGADNFLVPSSSELYQEALANTEMSKRTISIKDMKPGDQVWLKTGKRGRYLGLLNFIRTSYSGGTSKQIFDRAHFFDIEGDAQILKQKSPKIGEIIAGEPLTPADALMLANAKKPYDVIKFLGNTGKLTTRSIVKSVLPAEIGYRDVVVGRRPSGDYVYCNTSYGHFAAATTQAVHPIETIAWETEQKIVTKNVLFSNRALYFNAAEIAACQWWTMKTELLCDGEPVDFI